MREIIGEVSERVNKLIIQSNQMNMGARRSFRTSQGSYFQNTGWNSRSFAGSITRQQTLYTQSNNAHPASVSHPKDQNGAHAAESETDRPDIADTGTSGRGQMNDLFARMNASSGIHRRSLLDNIRAFNQIRQQTLDYLLYTLFGRTPGDDAMTSATENNNNNDFSEMFSQLTTGSNVSADVSGASGSYYSYFYYSEQETTCFDASGTAVTADGRTIPFSISLEMSRSFTEIAAQRIDFQKPRMCDPLVINLDFNVANVSDQKFLFDIDADGKEDLISTLGAGSGYLALDRNSDGKINDGSELFGTASGNGFADLAQYDKDGNGWIDEADEIFSMLRIWTKDANGRDELLTLKEAGVGAIYLGYENTDFSLNSMEDNTPNAMIRKSGIFLYENGGSGTVQQLDLAT